MTPNSITFIVALQHLSSSAPQQPARHCKLQLLHILTYVLHCCKHVTCRLVNTLNADHGIADFVEFYEASGGLPAVYLMHPRGHTVEIHLQVRDD
jgi:hypothetical protein